MSGRSSGLVTPFYQAAAPTALAAGFACIFSVSSRKRGPVTTAKESSETAGLSQARTSTRDVGDDLQADTVRVSTDHGMRGVRGGADRIRRATQRLHRPERPDWVDPKGREIEMNSARSINGLLLAIREPFFHRLAESD
ncbi:hypothetical protein PISL3812_09981 [Talaromyces islandicus]|uniref:Uncharacterized protein n=1 Tax=Talaromyces islandicus TaxID=28573 RepID=A0A0U1MBC0_TALIS|nr:hypothetical protein PISL3812_09981 [Talaromyces islandicus]